MGVAYIVWCFFFCQFTRKQMEKAAAKAEKEQRSQEAKIKSVKENTLSNDCIIIIIIIIAVCCHTHAVVSQREQRRCSYLR